jgi:hypothetical protein
MKASTQRAFRWSGGTSASTSTRPTSELASRGLHVAHFFNALSIFFPEGEKFFIDSVRHYREQIASPTLERDVNGFIGQEAMHSREHRRYNAALERVGLPIAELEGRVKDYLETVRERTDPREQLAVTIALEHFTAIMAHTVLSDERSSRMRIGTSPRSGAGTQSRRRSTRPLPTTCIARCGEGTRAWIQRSVIMLLVTIDFWLRVFRYHFRLVRADGALGDVRGWWRLFRWLWLSPAVCVSWCAPGCRTSDGTSTPGSTTTRSTSRAGRPRMPSLASRRPES